MTVIRVLPLLLAVSSFVGAQHLRELKPHQGKQIYFKDIEPEDAASTNAAAPSPAPNADQGIIGGSDVVPGQFPFYGHFLGDVMCGGALIHEDLFLTAAHCLEKGFPAKIRIGATQTVSDNEGQEVIVCTAIVHPNNNMKSMSNDIAILKLCDPVSITAYAQYNRDPSKPGATGTDLWMLGFGRTTIDGGLSPILQVARVDYLQTDVCAARYNKYNGDETMCADSPTNAICYGDSGGPLMDVNNVVMGLSSYIVDTCASDYPDFFTRVSSYGQWIDDMVCTQAFTPPTWCSTATGTGGGSTGGGSTGGGGGGGGGGTQQDPPTDTLTQCLTLIFGLLTSLLGRR